ncbi:MAG: nickel pincer cofactor biosynthesis protein LarB [Desulfobacterales bacterium]|nr:nickel pincer cofactor biosynthesis protein LarB [Desulfobacterales bacterium]
MDATRLKELLLQVKNGGCGIDEALNRLRHWPSEEMGFACLDHHRSLRTGMPEVVYGEGKTAAQLIGIIGKMVGSGGPVIATRVDPDKAGPVRVRFPDLVYHRTARMLTGAEKNFQPCPDARGGILVLSAGTSDLPVAEEALVTARALGHPVSLVNDVGVAGVHRLLAHRELLDSAIVLIVVAGMEGALPSVVGGLVARPVVAVPTSVGYGTGLGGLAALLGMLNSCAPGMAVVNIDNGFGAACMAAAINRG